MDEEGTLLCADRADSARDLRIVTLRGASQLDACAEEPALARFHLWYLTRGPLLPLSSGLVESWT